VVLAVDVLARVGRLRAVTDAESALLAAASAVASAAAALGSGPSLLAVTARVIGACRAQLEVVEVIIAALVADLRYAAGLFSVEAARVLHPAEAASMLLVAGTCCRDPGIARCPCGAARHAGGRGLIWPG